jgi:predicted permease
MLAWTAWRNWFAGRDDVIGARVRIDDVPVTVVGVMPPGFAFPDSHTVAWLPMPVAPVVGAGDVRRVMIFGALARLKPGSSFAQAAAEGTARARTAPDPGMAAVSLFGSAAAPEIQITSAVDAMTAEVRPAIRLLLGGVVLLFVTAMANIGNLQLARATARRREIALRAAIGAGRARLRRQLLVESGVIALAGGAGGLLLAMGLHRVLPVLLPPDFPRADQIAIDPIVLAFALAVSLAATAVCGTFPALQLRAISLVEALAEGSAASVPGPRRSRGARLRTAVMAGQVALGCVLLVGAALLARSFQELLHADRGYDPANLLTARVDAGATYDGPRRAELVDAIVTRLQGMPGVAVAAGGNALPFTSMGGNVGFRMRSPANPAIEQDVQTLTRLVSPTYFDALRLRVIAGRPLTAADTPSSRPVVVVNRSFAHRYLGESPIGMRLPMRFGEGRPDCDVVGVVEDMRQGQVTDAPAPEVFVSYHQMPSRLLSGPLIVVVRTRDDPVAHAAALRTVIRERDPSLSIGSIMTLDERVATSLARPRLYAVVLGGFAAGALVIASVGLFGVLSYGVTQRAREIGVRTALGAQTWDIVSLVLRDAAAIAAVGLAVGMTTALLGSRLVEAFLYGVAPHDPLTFAAVAGVLGLAAAVACIVPARGVEVTPPRPSGNRRPAAPRHAASCSTRYLRVASTALSAVTSAYSMRRFWNLPYSVAFDARGFVSP